MKEESLLLLSDLQKLINQVVLIDYTIIILGGIVMARRKLSIDDKIEQQKLAVSKAKDRYEAELEELNQLMKKRDELRNKELLQAIEQSKRSFEEIMDFFSTDDSQD